MVKPITFIELVRAAYEAAPKKLAPNLFNASLTPAPPVSGTRHKSDA